MSVSRTRTATFSVTLAAGLAFVAAQWPVAAEQGQAQGAPASASSASAPRCGAHGVIQSGTEPLAGAAVSAKAGDRLVAVTSTDLDGSYFVPLAAGTYTLHVELTAFTASDHDVTVSEASCTPTVDLKLALGPRTLPPAASAAASASSTNTLTPSPNAPAATTTAQAQGPATGANAPGPAAGANQPQGRGGGRGGFPNTPRFQSLAVQQSANAPAASTDTVELSTAIQDDPASRLLPAGFSLDAPQESVAVNGTTIQLDRGQMADRMAALANGDFGLADGAFGQPGQVVAGGFGGGDAGGGGGGGGRGGGGGFGGPGGIGGRLGGANRMQINANYQFGGSPLDSKPYPLNGVQQAKPSYVQQTASTTIGGPLKIPHIYDGSRRTTFNFSFTGSRDGNLFDQYATVPSDAWRSGDFSSSSVPIVDPNTGLPFPGNVIPDNRISTAAKELLQYVPHALDSQPTTTRNFENTGTTHSKTNQFSLRITHMITAPPAQGRGGRGGAAGGAGGGRGGGAAGGAAAGARGGAAGANGQGRGAARPPQLNITLNATINYRHNQNDRFNVFPALDGTTKGSTISVPVTVNMRYGRSVHNFTFNYNQTKSESANPFQFNTNVAGLAGITGVSQNPFDWGVPSISFGSNLTGISGSSPSNRVNKSWQVGYTWTRPAGKHSWRIGTDFQQQNNFLQQDQNAAGLFTFSGLYTANGQKVTTGSGQDFADFLLGMPQTAQLQCAVSTCGSTAGSVPKIQIAGRVFDAFIQDDFRWKPRWTISYGVRYEYTGPFTESNGNMVNLDFNTPLTQVAAVFPNGVGPFSGSYPSSLVNPDWNNVAPRVGVAWRATNRAVIRFGYGLTYNNGTYSNIARQLYSQPPFFDTETVTGSLLTPLSIDNALSLASVQSITNNYAIAKNYQLGLIHQWNFDYSRDLFKTWAVGSTYVGTLGRSLDMLTAPNQAATGEILSSVQAFNYQNSTGRSYSNSVSFRLQKRQSHGVSGTVQYTLAKSRDDTTATSGGTALAQDSQNIAAEWAPSNFDRRHQVTATATIQLPWGVDRHWLASGGPLASIVGDWSLSANLTWQSGSPLTARCSACPSDLARGTAGSLRADYLGGNTALASPIIGANGQITFFNVGAFAVPAPGTFGDSLRNMIIGPGSHVLNATFSRDVRLGGNRGVTISVSVSNLLNTVNYGSIDTNVASPTFGQVTSIRQMRSARASLRFRF